MPRWVEHESEDEAASTSDEEQAEQQQQHASPQQAAKRKAVAPEAGPSSNKKVKLSISLSRAKLECHVRHREAACCLTCKTAPGAYQLLLAGLWPERTLCRLCGLSISGLPQ